MSDFSLIVTLPREKVDAISKRALQLGVKTGYLASFLLIHGLGIDALSSIDLEEPRLIYIGKNESGA